MAFHQIDCFGINMKFWKILGVWVKESPFPFYRLYSKLFVLLFIVIYDSLSMINLIFVPFKLDLFVEELIFFFMEVGTFSKVMTFYFMRDKLAAILDALERPIFDAANDEEAKIIKGAKRFIRRYWKIVTAVSITSYVTHIFTPFIVRIFLPVTIELPVCSYSFLSVNTTRQYIYPLYLYQSFGMHCHLWYNVNIDSFFLGLMILTIAQLEILDLKLRTVTEAKINEDNVSGAAADNLVLELNKCIIHFDEVGKFCGLVEEVFSATLFMQFNMASCIICVILFRFTLPAPKQYFIFLGTYMFVMTIQIFVPCWFGTRIMDKSVLLCLSVYHCNWTGASRQFKSNMRLFVERANRPLSITGGKMFSLSLSTFTSIMNSSYSFFTLLRHMQSRE